MTRTETGFTLVELLIVTAFISVLAGVAVPNLLTSRAAANERAIVATLRTVATAQAQVMSANSLDGDSDGIGEALSLIELAGRVELRGTAVRLEPTALSVALGTEHSSGFITNKGYLLGLYLPDAAGVGVLGTQANFGTIDTDRAESSWTCVAWPVTRGASGSATFFINEMAEIMICRQADYSGPANAPPAGAALVGVPPATIVGGTLAVSQVGADGNTWLTMQ